MLGFWFATDFANLKRRKNNPAQKAVGIDRVAGSVGKDRPRFWLSDHGAMRLELGGQPRNDWDRQYERPP